MDSIELNFKSETRVIQFLLKTLFFFIHLAIMTEMVAHFKISYVIRLIFFLYFVRPYHQTIKNRYYTYWTFSGLLFVYLLIKINEQFFQMHQDHIGVLYLIATLLLIAKMYILSSPIYYPRVSWWEYDFRYRDDLKITVKNKYEKILEARLTDLRRLAGCVALFEDLKLGEEIIVNAKVGVESVTLRGQVMSKRRELLGRPLIYGIQFKFDSKTNKKRYSMLEKMWKKEKNNKRKSKFANVT
jgi:hypothetical protein